MSSGVSICPSCLIRVNHGGLLRNSASWRTKRHMTSEAQRRKKPKRMTLASDVSRSLFEQKSNRKTAEGPFGSTNVREVPLELRYRQERRTRTAGTTSSKPKGKGKEDDRPLFHALKMQQSLSPLSYPQRDRIKEKLEGIKSFEELGLTEPVAQAIYTQALPGLLDYMPTPVQKLAIPALLAQRPEKGKKSEYKYNQFLVAAETGSGKTLAYALPVIDAVKRQEYEENTEQAAAIAASSPGRATHKTATNLLDPADYEDTPNPKAGKPRALILLPSSELVRQVGQVIKVMSHTLKYRSAAISSSNTATVIRSRLFNPSGIDVVVSTPHLISSIAEKEPNVLSRLQYLVVDEADSLLDRSFSEITCGIIDRSASSLKQLIFCSATIPRSMDKFLDKRYPEIKRLVTPKLHSITRRVQLGVIDIEKEPYRGNRNLACADVIWQIGKAEHDDTSKHHTIKCIMVFVNEREQAEELAKFLASKGIDAAPLTRDTSESRQGEILSAFTSAEPVQGDEKPEEGKKRSFRDFVPFEGPQPGATSSSLGSRRLPNTKVLVTTDLGSRGIDTLSVRHVILYDVPHTTIDFVHRLGRVGRMGRRGRGVVLVGNKDRKDVVREVREAMFRGQALI